MNRVVPDICRVPLDSFSILLCQAACAEGLLIIKWIQWSFLDMPFASLPGYPSACLRGLLPNIHGVRMGTIHGLNNKADLSSASADCPTAEFYAESPRWHHSLGTTWEKVDYIRLSHYEGTMLCLHRDRHNPGRNHSSSLALAILLTLTYKMPYNLHVIQHAIISDQRYVCYGFTAKEHSINGLLKTHHSPRFVNFLMFPS